MRLAWLMLSPFSRNPAGSVQKPDLGSIDLLAQKYFVCIIDWKNSRNHIWITVMNLTTILTDISWKRSPSGIFFSILAEPHLEQKFIKNVLNNYNRHMIYNPELKPKIDKKTVWIADSADIIGDVFRSKCFCLVQCDYQRR